MFVVIDVRCGFWEFLLFCWLWYCSRRCSSLLKPYNLTRDSIYYITTGVIQRHHRWFQKWAYTDVIDKSLWQIVNKHAIVDMFCSKWISRKKPEMIIRPEIGQRVKLSPGDIAQANALYSCPSRFICIFTTHSRKNQSTILYIYLSTSFILDYDTHVYRKIAYDI
jgi:hypothetical protein